MLIRIMKLRRGAEKGAVVQVRAPIGRPQRLERMRYTSIGRDNFAKSQKYPSTTFDMRLNMTTTALRKGRAY